MQASREQFCAAGVFAACVPSARTAGVTAWQRAAVAALALYALRQTRAARPLLRLRELLRPRYASGVMLFGVAYLV